MKLTVDQRTKMELEKSQLANDKADGIWSDNHFFRQTLADAELHVSMIEDCDAIDELWEAIDATDNSNK